MFAKLKALHEMGALSGEMGATVAAAVQGGARVDTEAQAEYVTTNVALDEFLASKDMSGAGQ
jgi:hypothetical protein